MSGPVVGPCIRSVNKPNPTHGYALRVIGGRRQYEHRAAWEAVNGPIPEGMVLDHLCHDPKTCPAPGRNCPHRSCRNPEHLAPITRGENVKRGFNAMSARTHCPQRHPYDAANTYVNPRTGRRHCRICTRRAIAAHKARKRASR